VMLSLAFPWDTLPTLAVRSSDAESVMVWLPIFVAVPVPVMWSTEPFVSGAWKW